MMVIPEEITDMYSWSQLEGLMPEAIFYLW